jgi:serpin B
MNPSQRQDVVTNATKMLSAGTALKVTSGINEFGFDLFRKLAAVKGASNVCISPVSVESVLAQLYGGAQGATQKQIATALGVQKLTPDEITEANRNLLSVLNNVDADKVQINVSNSLWVDTTVPINPDFIAKDEENYKAKVTTLDFHSKEAAPTINDWVKQSTNGKIPSIIDSVPPDARLYAINAVYFKADWTQPFKKERTHDQDFTLLDGTTKQTVPMMTQEGTFNYFATSDAIGVALPYGSGRLEMLLVLPTGKNDFAGLVKSLDGATWKNWLKAANSKSVTVTIPKFKSDYASGLNTALKSLGVLDAFDSTKADFGAMLVKATGTAPAAQKLFLSDVKHKTYIAVDEKGTEAAAATSAQMSATAVRLTVNFTADHPFIYAIRDTQTGTILFQGELTDPKGAATDPAPAKPAK